MKTVVTHSGTFHADDVLAVAAIMHLEGKENVRVVRSRKQEDWDKGDWVVDVGGVYDPETLRFDHHQPGAPVRDNGIGYSAIGLVWKHFGEQICGSKEVANEIEEKLVLPIDAHDVGVNIYELNEYEIRPAEFFYVIQSFWPPWRSELDKDEQFLKAVDLSFDYFSRLIDWHRAEVEAQKLADELHENVDKQGVIVSEESISAYKFIKFKDAVVLVAPDSDGSGNWTAELIRTEPHLFEYKKYFPSEWEGLRGGELEEISGIEGAIFSHKSRFYFKAKSKEAAIKATEFLA